jgi:hypothetical protein
MIRISKYASALVAIVTIALVAAACRGGSGRQSGAQSSLATSPAGQVSTADYAYVFGKESLRGRSEDS